MPVLTGPQVAQLVKEAGFPPEHHATMVAIAKAESNWRTNAINTSNSNGSIDRGLFQINSVHGKDPNKLLNDVRYNTAMAKEIYDRQGLQAWSTYNNGAYRKHMPEARQAVANAGGLTGAPAMPGSDPAANQSVVYGPPGPEITRAGKGVPSIYNAPTDTGAIGSLRVLGKDLAAELGTVVIGDPSFLAGMDTIPHIDFTVVDPSLNLAERDLFAVGARVQWLDLDMRIDTAKYEPGDHGAGQAALTAEDDIVHALRNLRGPRTASGISATEWLAQELSAVHIDPNRFLLGESVPSQSEIARDAPDPGGGGTSEGQEPSAWTTIVRLADELGKWVFVSGRRIVFGSAAFAMTWCAPQPVKLGWENAPAGEQFVSAPTAEHVSVADRAKTLQVTGRVPHERAPVLRPGVAVEVYGIPGLPHTRSQPHRMMVSDVQHILATDVDGADITLIDPVDPPPNPPGQTDPNGGPTGGVNGVTGGGADGQVETFVRLSLSQTGKRYIFGAEAAPSDPNPRAFDCSELIEWAAARSGIPGVPDGSAQQINAARAVSVETGILTRGAFLYQPGHIAISLGNGRTIEASNASRPVGQLNARGRGWTRAGLMRNAKGYRVRGQGGGARAV